MTTDPGFTGERTLLPALEPHLEKGERVRWAGRPNVYSILRTKSGLWWIGGMWLAIWLAVYLLGWISWTVFTPLGLVGVAFVAGPFVILWESDKTVYAITDRRALVVHNGMKFDLASIAFDRMDEKLEVLETGFGSGHVYFASDFPTRQRNADHTGKLAFRDVGQAHNVAKILDAARKQ